MSYWQTVAGPLRLEDLLFQAKKANRIAPLQVVRADLVFGEAHLQTAIDKAERATAEGRNHADRLEVEFTRYLAGERQIRKAIDKMGVPDGAEAAVIVGLTDKGEDAVRYFIHGLGLEEIPLPTAEAARVIDFGITEAALAATPDRLHIELVLEQVAAVDLMRK